MIREQLSPTADPPAPRRPDHEAHWHDLVERHGARVRSAVSVALRSFGERPDPDRVDDLVQEVWCRLLERERRRRTGPRCERDGETAVYLRRVAASVVADVLRADGAAKRRPRQLLPLELARPGLEREPADRRSCPLRVLLARDQLRRYLALCAELLGPRRARERRRIVHFALVVGLTSADIVRRIGAGWTATGVDSMMFRLRRRLAARGESLPVRGTRSARP